MRRLSIRHSTRYQYSSPVPRSTHLVRLRPVQDAEQLVLSHTLTAVADGVVVPAVEFEDVFGNRAARFEVYGPYTELVVAAESTVTVDGRDPFDAAVAPTRPVLPLTWMPWESPMMAHYLAPPDLPESQLSALYDYAWSFAHGNNWDLVATLFAVNLALFRDYEYVAGETGSQTTAHDVFRSRRGVCQDFANLFVCLARLLNVPARYVCGYVYVADTAGARSGSDSSHAWAELYLPGIGWRGYDPTNGVLTRSDHVRVAHGRSHHDATPTTGALDSRAEETLSVDVEVRDLPR